MIRLPRLPGGVIKTVGQGGEGVAQICNLLYRRIGFCGPSDKHDRLRITRKHLPMLIYIRGRNTKDLDLLMSVEAMRQLPELEISEQSERFVRGRFRSVQVDLLLTSHPLFKIVSQRFATEHRFAELKIPTATVEGLIVLKLYALPSLYRQMDMDKVALYENDITMLLARHSPELAPLLE